MSSWNHSICDDCWNKRCEERGEAGRVPVRVVDPEPAPCCFCSKAHASGIFVREDPKALSCSHPDDE